METNSTPVDNPETTKISLAALSEMTGFPMELIQKELFTGVAADGEVALEDLRAAMLNFIDATMMADEKEV